jgi:hypothetical protein
LIAFAASMKPKRLGILLVSLLIVPVFLNYASLINVHAEQKTPDIFIGVDVAYENLTEIKKLIDEVSSYTNFFIIGCDGNYNDTRLTIISQYVYDKGLSFIVYSDEPTYPSAQWLETAKNTWGNKFLGIYFYDEPGGKQLDQSNYPVVTFAENFSDAANKYVSTINWWLRSGPYSITKSFTYPGEYQLFTSDYGLYWYDYQAGYDTVFAEFGNRIGFANDSRQLQIALCRGAAAAQDKDWGVMITWAYNQTPYMEPGPDLYNDMVLAYENGAKYIVVFDSNANYTQNVLDGQQLGAMKQFWQYAQANPRNDSQTSDRTAYVLPEDFAYGFRDPKDKIWGLWSPDIKPELYNITTDIGMSVTTLLQMDGPNLDIVYPNGTEPIESSGYGKVLYWNDPSLIPGSPTVPPVSPAGQPSTLPRLQHVTSLLSYVTEIGFYAVAAGIIAAVAAALVLKKRRQHYVGVNNVAK